MISKSTALLFENDEEKLSPENELVNELEEEISQRRIDETGAEREQFAEESAKKLFEQALEFSDGQWKVKEGYEDIAIHAITLPTLTRINTLGHAEGNKLLNGLRAQIKGNCRVFHTLGADFLAISKGEIDMPQETIGDPIQGIPQLIATRTIPLTDLLDKAQADMLPPGEKGETRIAKREFARALFIETSRQREEEKLLKNIQDFKERFESAPREAKEHYEAFLRYQFEGVAEGIDTSNANWILENDDQNLVQICEKAAANRSIGPVAERRWEKKIQKDLKIVGKEIDEDERLGFMEKEPAYRTAIRRYVENVEKYLENPTETKFPIEELNGMLAQLGKEGRKIENPEDPKVSIKLANTILNRYALEFDKMTGFKGKTRFQEDIDEAVKSGKKPNLGIIDLGYLKYFNYLGNRELGDHAIKKSGWIIEQAAAGLEDIEIYRIGGDEFAIKAKDPTQLETMQKRIDWVIQLEQGNIPSDGKTHEYYETQKLEFNWGTCTPELAEKIYEEVENEYSNGEDLTPEERQRRLAELMVLIADLNLESNKTIIRFRTVTRKLLKEVDPGNPRSKEVFRKFLAFSGKALRGFYDVNGVEQLKQQMLDIAVEDDSPSIWEEALKDLVLDTTDRSAEEDIQLWVNALNKVKEEDYEYGNGYSQQLVNRVRQAIRANR